MSFQISEVGLFVLASFGVVFFACRYGGKVLIRFGWKSLEIDTRTDEKPRDDLS